MPSFMPLFLTTNTFNKREILNMHGDVQAFCRLGLNISTIMERNLLRSRSIE